MLNKILKALRNPRLVLLVMLYRSARIFPDKIYLKLLFRLRMGYWMDFDNPQTFNEKLQWLKLHNRKPEYTQMVDKVGAKEYVARIIGEKYIIPTLGVFDSADEIDFDALPNQFVLKCTHDSGGLVICTDKKSLNIEVARKKLSKYLKRQYYYQSREWPYKNVSPRIIAEKYLTHNGEFLADYKWYCFDGVPKCMVIASGRYVEPQTCFDYFDMEFNHLSIEQGGPNYKRTIPRPILFDEMKHIASQLSKGLPHARIDLFEANGQIYFGEITFFDSSGCAQFKPIDWDYTFGSWIKLPIEK